jgi:hypothetical protein
MMKNAVEKHGTRCVWENRSGHRKHRNKRLRPRYIYYNNNNIIVTHPATVTAVRYNDVWSVPVFFSYYRCYRDRSIIKFTRYILRAHRPPTAIVVSRAINHRKTTRATAAAATGHPVVVSWFSYRTTIITIIVILLYTAGEPIRPADEIFLKPRTYGN